MKLILFLLLMMGCWNDMDDVSPCGTVTDTGQTQFDNQWVMIAGDKYLVYDTTLVVNIGDWVCVDSLGHTLKKIK